MSRDRGAHGYWRLVASNGVRHERAILRGTHAEDPVSRPSGRCGESMGSRTYVIAVRPGGQPQVTVFGPRDTLLALAPSMPLPEIVRAAADWLLALAENRPLPPGAPPPVVIAPRRNGASFMALVTHDDKQ